MKITDIRNKPVQTYQPVEILLDEQKKNQSKTIQDKVEISSASSNWQKDILLSALDMLENNIHVDNNTIHPLDKSQNQPIETFEEALIELNFLKTEKFSKEASSAQANIKARDVASLFLEEAA